MTELNLDAVREGIKKKATLVKWGLGLGAALLLAPLVWLLAYAALGVAALGVATALAAAVGLAIVNFAPVVAMKFQNAKLAAIKAEARRNPVETMQNVYVEREVKIHETGKRIEAFNTKVNRFENKCVQFAKDFPDEAPRFRAVLEKMQRLLKERQDKWLESRDGLALYGKLIVKADAIWQMGLAAADLQESAGDVEVNFMQRLRSETAYDAVENQLAQSMAQLDMLLLERVDESDVPKALTHQPADVLEMQTVTQPVHARRQ